MDADDRTVFPSGERTLLMPRPGGEPTRVSSRPGARSRADADLQRLVAGVNPLLDAAAPLLALAGQLRATAAHADPARLRAQLLEHVAAFEAAAGAQGVPRHQVGAARYLLCSVLDEAIDATPWGSGGAWSPTLLQAFHDEPSGADKVFKLLDKLGEDPVANAELLQLFYVCIALGYEGRYRGQPNGRAQLEAIAERVLAVTRTSEAAAAARTLSAQWEGVATEGNRDLRVLPLWALGATCGALLLGLVLVLNQRLDDMAGPLFRALHAVPAALRAERAPAAPAPARLAPLLQADVAAGAVAVREEAQRSVVTLGADSLFVPGSARLDPGRAELLARIARAMAARGEVLVVGHTDDSAPRSLQFPSNWHLSRERAEAVAAELARHGVPPERLRSEGRADAEPAVAGGGEAARARNRRIEIEWRLPRPQAR